MIPGLNNSCFYGVLIALFLSTTSLSAQLRDERTGHYLVEAEKFSPPDSAIIAHYIGRKAMAFMATDINQQEQFLGNYAGKLVLLWFGKLDCQTCLEQLMTLHKIQATHVDELGVIALCDDSREMLTTILADPALNFPVIPNAALLAEGAYAHDLGYPRLFFLDQTGIIRHIFPASFFEQKPDFSSIIKHHLDQYR